jgi:hypothetical protein
MQIPLPGTYPVIQEEEEVIHQANALVGEANDSNEHPITVTIIVILSEYS